jgi:hypothetical protein
MVHREYLGPLGLVVRLEHLVKMVLKEFLELEVRLALLVHLE